MKILDEMYGDEKINDWSQVNYQQGLCKFYNKCAVVLWLIFSPAKDPKIWFLQILTCKFVLKNYLKCTVAYSAALQVTMLLYWSEYRVVQWYPPCKMVQNECNRLGGSYKDVLRGGKTRRCNGTGSNDREKQESCPQRHRWILLKGFSKNRTIVARRLKSTNFIGSYNEDSEYGTGWQWDLWLNIVPLVYTLQKRWTFTLASSWDSVLHKWWIIVIIQTFDNL